MNFFSRLLLSSVAVILTTYLLPGISITGDAFSGFITAFVVALVISFLNVTVKPLLIILTIPITLLSLGLFLLVINALVILMVDAMIAGFVVDGFWWALVFSLVLTLVNSFLSGLSGAKNQK